MSTTTDIAVELGDVVILRTGSLEMVFDEWIGENRALCKWYNEGEFKSAEFSVYSLIKAE